MITIVDSTTGEVLFCSIIPIDLQENETIIDGGASGKFYNFDTQEFYAVN